MVTPRLSPSEIKLSIENATPFIELVKKVRRGKWSSREILAAAGQLDRHLAEKQATNDYIPDEDFESILALLSVMFYSKDKFGYSRESKEYQSVERLYGSLLAALGSG